MTIEHVLFDADGVLQDVPGGWHAAMEPYLGDQTEAFFRETWSHELPMLSGHGDYMPVLESALTRYGVTESVEEIYRAVWHRIELVDTSIALVRELRAAGFGVHLATNQEKYRGGHMRSALGYDELFDVSCYSYDLGAMKPDRAFFEEALRRIGADASTVLFIDDTVVNVLGARDAGLAAERWHFEQGHEVLLGYLAEHGVFVRGAR